MTDDNIIILRYGEMHLKGKNRGLFEKKLIENIKLAIKGIECRLVVDRGRYEIVDYVNKDECTLLKSLGTVFGLHSYSVARVCKTDIDAIAQVVLSLYKGDTFKIETHRADKEFGLNSLQVSREIGFRVLQHFKNAVVDVHNPKSVINIDIRENKKTYIYTNFCKGLGGLPYGTAGKGIVMLSGGIDSPVATFMMGKRGLTLDAVHFWSYPYTGQNAKQKVIELKNILSKYCIGINLYVVPFTKIQEAIRDNCEPSYLITLIRRQMMKISQKLAVKLDAKCIVNGECLGQVASQTLESMVVTSSVTNVPILRPLVGFDKQDIIELAYKIGTYETSILPYEDCCTVFMPKSPTTKPTLERCIANEQKISNLDELIDMAVADTHICNE